ncbi:MAG TPA: hypothetical protein VIJ18_05080 [Microbacteriaceae bacterium]
MSNPDEQQTPTSEPNEIGAQTSPVVKRENPAAEEGADAELVPSVDPGNARSGDESDPATDAPVREDPEPQSP